MLVIEYNQKHIYHLWKTILIFWAENIVFFGKIASLIFCFFQLLAQPQILFHDFHFIWCIWIFKGF